MSAHYEPDSERDGVALIAAERQRQIEQEGWTPEHDDEHARGELGIAAQCYINTAGDQRFMAPHWPWDPSWWKPSGNKIRDLVKAGALIAAEIDRLHRLPAPVHREEGERNG